MFGAVLHKDVKGEGDVGIALVIDGADERIVVVKAIDDGGEEVTGGLDEVAFGVVDRVAAAGIVENAFAEIAEDVLDQFVFVVIVGIKSQAADVCRLANFFDGNFLERFRSDEGQDSVSELRFCPSDSLVFCHNDSITQRISKINKKQKFAGGIFFKSYQKVILKRVDNFSTYPQKTVERGCGKDKVKKSYQHIKLILTRLCTKQGVFPQNSTKKEEISTGAGE